MKAFSVSFKLENTIRSDVRTFPLKFNDVAFHWILAEGLKIFSELINPDLGSCCMGNFSFNFT